MVAVLVCSIVNAGLIIGLLAGIAAGMLEARAKIAAALRADPSPGFRPTEGSAVRALA